MTSIVLRVCEEHGVTPEDFFAKNKRFPELTRARVAAMWALKEAGFKRKAIARLIRRNYSTVNYWMVEGERARCKVYRDEYNRTRRVR